MIAHRTFALTGLLLCLAACRVTTGDEPGADPVVGNPNGEDNGGACRGGADCKSGLCTAGTCAVNPDAPPQGPCGTAGQPACVDPSKPAPSATDGLRNGGETDVDCGGAGAPVCADGKGCKGAPDCASTVCGSDGRCAAPSATDGVKNGDETDVDCGGSSTSAPKCGVDKACAAHSDCGSDACSYAKKCVAVKSCTAHHGGDTCGAGEVDGGHESCCTTIPGSPVDKYNVTAGRFRTFVERTNGNLRGYLQANAPAWWDASWNQYLPTQLDSGGDVPDYSGVYQELGPVVHGTAGGANMGCFVDGYGTRTYRLPDAINARMGDQQHYSQEVLDEKPINCVTAYMVAAFCAWDGGRMPTKAEWDEAWGGSTYPWGAAPAPAGWPAAFDSDATGIAPTPANGDVKRANYNYNYWSPTVKVSHDYSLYIAAPGRFPTGASPQGHQDMAGSVFNFQTLSGTQVAWSKSGSWQGHAIPYGNALVTSASNKYWATGGRCAR
ncbi:hypothetical protein BH11MYX4_BH11MYX4_00450 [soil metagenome]